MTSTDNTATETATCNHEDCDCHRCDTCGEHFADGEGEVFTVRFPIGYDDWETETQAICRACQAREEAAGRAAEEAAYAEMAHEPFDGEDDIPF